MTTALQTPRLMAQLAAFRLASAALPIGAFAYSQGLEAAVTSGAVSNAAQASRWICGMLRYSLLTLDIPVLLRLQRAWATPDDAAEVKRWSALLLASRATQELRDEERQLGGALYRLFAKQGVERAVAWVRAPERTLAGAFALAAVEFGLTTESAAASYAFAWAEAQVGAATRLVPLGQTAAQAVLSDAMSSIERGLPAALELGDEHMGATTPGQTLLSALHETQYSRLFRS